MKPLILGVGIAISVAMLAILFGSAFWSWVRSPFGSFTDFLKHPDMMPDLESHFVQVERDAESLRADDSKVSKAVDQYVFGTMDSADRFTLGQTLDRAGDAVHTRVVEILKDEALQPKLTERVDNGGVTDQKFAFCRLCDLFGTDNPPSADLITLFSPYLKHAEEDIRKHAALVIGMVGTRAALEDLKTIFRDPQPYVRSYALIGISRAVKGEYFDETSRDDYFDLLQTVFLTDNSFEARDEVPKLLFEIAPSRAKDCLLSDQVLTTNFRGLSAALEELFRRKVMAPRERLRDFVGQTQANLSKYPNSYIAKWSLALLGLHRHEEDLTLLTESLDSPEEYVADGAVMGLKAWYGFESSIRNPGGVLAKNGREALTQVERYTLALDVLDAEVVNGGFSQYFFNSSGDTWRDAIEALEAISAVERVAILRNALGKFADAKPSEKTNVRRRELAKLVRKDEDLFKAEDAAWYASKEHLKRLLFKLELKQFSGPLK